MSAFTSSTKNRAGSVLFLKVILDSIEQTYSWPRLPDSVAVAGLVNSGASVTVALKKASRTLPKTWNENVSPGATGVIDAVKTPIEFGLILRTHPLKNFASESRW